MTVAFHNDWDMVLKDEFEKPYYQELRAFLRAEYATHVIYPQMTDMWTAFQLTPFRDVSVVILGQDPYHGPNQAHGMSFSVQPGMKLPPSLRNIFKELSSDLHVPVPAEGMLTGWAKQGVLLLNTVLTVREGAAASHKGKGWEQFTDEVIRKLSMRREPIVFILWGKHAQEKTALINRRRHAIIESPHPSPFSASRGFFGSRPFSRTNDYLREWGRKPIDWAQTT
ncbi:uracil-DNA glycosylase [Sporosarcina sp. P37]|uniref:uracil-DNA glycosylase n=1 Tax=unclassified Sporosarcina TaxID=2647733 RepID=UPI0009BD05A2|nr:MULTISPECIES: uracil-DNA glycosylase [unclassified Sporosarcina]ARD48729.1 uracil-DNA glycosylase [Sporosarcina sp. P33]ARK25236.1 uracil-DNA glycosylase [Sporosarcina sp. P37]PID17155.1 uracil-DNA glycosylase [Sporosarcina sp. P35]